MPNPPVVVCDSDALVQLLTANHLAPLRMLRDAYGIRTAIVEEVEIEILSNPKLEQRVGKYLRKNLGGVLVRLDQQAFEGLAGLPKNTSWGDILREGARYKRYVDTGEAYTHAAAVKMGVPAMSNDWRAIKAAVTNGLPLSNPVLRPMDVICFGYQTGALSEAECDSFRQAMLGAKEFLPRDFQHTSFSKGLASFAPRLTCSQKALVGKPNGAGGIATMLSVTPIPAAPAAPKPT